MKTVGIIGGIGPEATVDYYQSIIQEYRLRTHYDSYPQIVINSINLRRMISLIETNDLPALIDFLSAECEKLLRAGADFGALAANTPHIVFDEVRRRVALPLISIVEATCEAVSRSNLRKVALLGTRFTMQSRFYPEVFDRRGIEIVIPSTAEQAFIHEKYMDEFIYGVFDDQTRKKMVEIISRMKREESIEAAILGGTELPLLLRDVPDCGVGFLDTSRIHVSRIVDEIV